MKNIYLFKSAIIVIALSFIITGCDKNEDVPDFNQPKQLGEKVTITASCNVPGTRVSYGEGEGRLDVFWKTNDAFRLYNGETVPSGNFTLAETDNGKKSGKFIGVTTAGTFNAFFPAQEGNSVWSAINVSYEGQTQDGINSTTHLAKYNYMVAKNITIADNEPTASFNFAHLGSVMQFDITLPDGYKPDVDGQPIEIIVASEGMVKSVKPSGEAGDATIELSLKLNNITLSSKNKTFTAYMMSAPFTIPSNGSLKITLVCKATLGNNTTTTFYEYEKKFASEKIYIAGKRYKFEGLGTILAFTPRKNININGVDFNFLMVRAGTFQMGSIEGEEAAATPRHWVKISKDYYIGETEVTQAQWKAIMKNNPSHHDGSISALNPEQATPIGEIQENRPVESIRWIDICKDNNNGLEYDYPICFLNTIKPLVAGNPTFNLPTEAQWEYAARGGHKWRLYDYMRWPGTDDQSKAIEYAWFGNWDGGDSNSCTHAVKGKKPNLLGLYDMGGNVYEMCLDNFDFDAQDYPDRPDENNPDIDPCVTVIGDDTAVIVRGGYYDEFRHFSCSAFRNHTYVGEWKQYIGFRLILVP